MTKRLLLWYAAALSAAIGVFFGFPALGLRSSDPGFVQWCSWCFAILVCQIGAAWYFLTSSGFTKGMKIFYTLLSIGIIFMGLAQLQLEVLSYVNGWQSWYAVYGVVLLPYIATTVAMYAAMRKLGRLMQIKLVWMNIAFVVALSTVSAAIVVAIFWPFQTSVISVVYDAMLSWAIAMGVATVAIAYRVRTELTPTFGSTVTWLIAGFNATILAGIQQLMLQHLSRPEWWYRLDGFSLWLLLLSSMLYLKAGLMFRELNRNLAVSERPLDVVMYVVGLVSRPRDIENILDRLRVLTAGANLGSDLTSKQQQELANIYLEIEQYLVTREPLRKFTAESLRVRLPDPFLGLLPKTSK